MLLRQSSLRVHARTAIRLTGRVGGGSRAGIYYRGTGHRTDLGASGVGNLVDLGRPADAHVCIGPALCFLFADVGRPHRAAHSAFKRAVPAGSAARQRGRIAKGGGRSMKNLDSVLAAYLAGWAIFFVYYISVAQRMSTLREEVERLKALLSKGK